MHGHAYRSYSKKKKEKPELKQHIRKKSRHREEGGALTPNSIYNSIYSSVASFEMPEFVSPP